jgi:hypothetical protein
MLFTPGVKVMRAQTTWVEHGRCQWYQDKVVGGNSAMRVLGSQAWMAAHSTCVTVSCCRNFCCQHSDRLPWSSARGAAAATTCGWAPHARTSRGPHQAGGGCCHVALAPLQRHQAARHRIQVLLVQLAPVLVRHVRHLRGMQQTASRGVTCDRERCVYVKGARNMYSGKLLIRLRARSMWLLNFQHMLASAAVLRWGVQTCNGCRQSALQAVEVRTCACVRDSGAPSRTVNAISPPRPSSAASSACTVEGVETE